MGDAGMGGLGTGTGAPLDGARRRLGRARLEQQQDERGQEHGGEEQEERDPGTEVRALTQPRRVSGDQVGQVQHVAERPADSCVPRLQAKVAASASTPPGGPAPSQLRPRPSHRPGGPAPPPGLPSPTFFWKVTPRKARSSKPYPRLSNCSTNMAPAQ